MAQEAPEANICERVGEVARAEIGFAVTFARKRQHGVRPGFDAAVNEPREMHAEEGKLRIGHGVDQMPDQMLPRFFNAGVAVANYAESGESIRSSLGAHRFDKVFSLMKPGDYLFVQFGHNDMKDKATNALETYKANLKKIIARTRELGGTPVLVTSMERKGGVEQDTLAGYPQTVRDVAAEDKCALIDLHAMSRTFYRALKADLGKAFQDGTHHNNYGSYELAKCIIARIKQDQLPLAKFIVDDFGVFDPAKPDDVTTFEMPASPTVSTEKPLGN